MRAGLALRALVERRESLASLGGQRQHDLPAVILVERRAHDQVALLEASAGCG